MTLNSKFKNDISTLRAAINEEIFLDVKNPKLYKKIKRRKRNRRVDSFAKNWRWSRDLTSIINSSIMSL